MVERPVSLIVIITVLFSCPHFLNVFMFSFIFIFSYTTLRAIPAPPYNSSSLHFNRVQSGVSWAQLVAVLTVTPPPPLR